MVSDIDLFGDDDEPDPEAERIKAERIAAYDAKKAAKAAKGDVVIAKSSILLDVKVGVHVLFVCLFCSSVCLSVCLSVCVV